MVSIGTRRTASKQGPLPGVSEPNERLSAELACHAAGRYNSYLSSIAPELPGDIARLVCLHLHDARITGVSNSAGNVAFVLNDMFAQRRYNRELVITFFEVEAPDRLMRSVCRAGYSP